MKKRNYGFMFLCISILVLSTLLLTGCVNNRETVEEEEVVFEDEMVQEEVSESIVMDGSSKFTSENQEIGTLGSETYEISFFTEKPMDGFHRFVFELDGGEVLPHVSAQYRPEFGAIRLVFQGIEEDNSGLGYQKSYNIDQEGVVRIYHNISPEEKEEVYDIGVMKSTEFSLYGEEVESGKWMVILEVRYPGESEIDVDTGSEEFNMEEQRIDGGVSSDGARITNYSYTIENNVFRFIWSVRGSSEKPIPEVRARYNDDGELTVIFPDLDSDYIARDSSEAELIGGIEKVSWNRRGDESIYRFVVGEERNFRLISSLGPNQVILEVEL